MGTAENVKAVFMTEDGLDFERAQAVFRQIVSLGTLELSDTILTSPSSKICDMWNRIRGSLNQSTEKRKTARDQKMIWEQKKKTTQRQRLEEEQRKKEEKREKAEERAKLAERRRKEMEIEHEQKRLRGRHKSLSRSQSSRARGRRINVDDLSSALPRDLSMNPKTNSERMRKEYE